MISSHSLLVRISKKVQRESRRAFAVMRHITSAERKFKYFYVSHHKCATQYTQSILRDVCDRKYISYGKFDWREKITPWQITTNKFLMIQDYSSDIIDWKSINGRGFHVIRDPRDILVSLYFSHKKSHIVTDPRAREILDNRQVLNELTQEEGLRYIMDKSEYFLRVMREIGNWDYGRADFYEARFEDITDNSQHEFAQIFAFLGIPVEDNLLTEILENKSFTKMKNKWKSDKRRTSGNHYRKGKSGDWKNYMSDELKHDFKQRYGDLLIHLGYDVNTEW